jgi:hypothetical protein
MCSLEIFSIQIQVFLCFDYQSLFINLELFEKKKFVFKYTRLQSKIDIVMDIAVNLFCNVV